MDALVGVAVELEDYTINRWEFFHNCLCDRGSISLTLQYQVEDSRLPCSPTHALLYNPSVTEGIEALAVTRVIVRPTGALARQGIVKNAQVLPSSPCCHIR